MNDKEGAANGFDARLIFIRLRHDHVRAYAVNGLVFILRHFGSEATLDTVTMVRRLSVGWPIGEVRFLRDH